jgi:NDP-sugar pyrophosphorylase family protein
MAGGLGSRLYPLTSILPKPLMPYNDKTLIENVIDSFSIYGLKKIIITINFKSKIIKAYFKEIYKKQKNIFLIKENKKLGTCGPLKNLKTKSKQIFITNCDTLLKIDYNDLLTFHIKNKNSLTIVSANIKNQIPYGICNLSNLGTLKSFDEKPIFHYLANVGFYILNTRVIKLIPKNKYYDMNEFIQLLIKKNLKWPLFLLIQSSGLMQGRIL